MKIAIIGGRDFNDYELVKKIMSKLPKQPTLIVSGGAKGADTLGEQWADEFGVYKQIFHARWNDLTTKPRYIKTRYDGVKYNALAGFNRNKDIINNSDLVIAFWDGKSKGTLDSITNAGEKGKQVIIVKY